MKLPSIHQLINDGLKALIRFPFAMLAAFAGSAASIYMISLDYTESHNHPFIEHLIWVSVIAFPLLVSASLFSESRNLRHIFNIILQIIMTGLMVAYLFFLPDIFLNKHIVRNFIFISSFHCLVSFAAFTANASHNNFWHFNKSLFLRILTGALYSMILYAGLALAILAIDNLFGVDVNEKYYFYLYIIIIGVFNPWYFLAGVPEVNKISEENTQYPKGLRIFTQFILAPLVALYLVILYAYTIKIIIQWEWPVGWVGYMLLSFSACGILSFLLIHPIRNQNQWSAIYSKSFLIALFPLIILLFLSILRRIDDYGITENRYFVLIYPFWLLAIVIYLLLTKMRNIKIIPVSLCIVALLSSFGPWGAFSISLNNQLSRIEVFMSKNNMLINGKVQKNRNNISFKDKREISSIVEYLTTMHGYRILQPFFTENLDTITKDTLYHTEYYDILNLMGVEYISRWQSEDYYVSSFYYNVENGDMSNVFDIRHFDIFLRLNQYLYYDTVHNDTQSFYSGVVNHHSIKAVFVTGNILRFIIDDSLSTEIKLNEFVQSLKEKIQGQNTYNISPELMTICKEDTNLAMKICFQRLNGKRENNKYLFNDINADVFLGIKSN
ncbi:MAG: DUF4153 domain-containing protein [Bacteroidia bacterium]|nr:DUF4153 domain-containing protein [Bacteroidia bacterium]